MVNDIWTSPLFILSSLVTLGVGLYSFVYSRIQMGRAYRRSLMTLASAVETKDVGSVGHGERVARYVVAMCKSLGLSGREARRFEYAAFLQDIGNVSVPHGILNKTSNLTQEEFETLKQHTVVGAEMFSEIKFLKDIAPIIRHHHESWDGSGYPDGLQGRDIPLGARILAVCTAYDSMMNSRAYRPRMNEDEVIRQLRADMGIKYDPEIVETFLRMQKKFR